MRILRAIVITAVSCHPANSFVPVTRTFTTSVNVHPRSILRATIYDEEVSVSRTSPTGETIEYPLRYRIHNRRSLSSYQAAPLLVLHGGPGIPSHYLEPLADVIPYRSIIFYDQLGCGRSAPGPEFGDGGSYSIDQSVDDLEVLIQKLGLGRGFHLYGQSFGGLLAFEYLKRRAEANDDAQNCRSVVLSSAPSNVDGVESVADGLLSTLLSTDPDLSTIMERFRMTHQCRTPTMPQPLLDAYENAAAPGSWRGSEVIRGYGATPPSDSASRMPSCLVLRGEFDFVTEECAEGWKDAFNHNFVRTKVLDGCSHHGLLEKGSMYGEVVDSYLQEYD